jgi:hypothetical protein
MKSATRLTSKGQVVRTSRGILSRTSKPSLGVERQRIDGGCGALQAVLAERPLFGVGRGVRTRGKLGHRKGADGNLDWQPGRLDLLEIDDHRGVEEPASRPQVSHRAGRPGQPRH